MKNSKLSIFKALLSDNLKLSKKHNKNEKLLLDFISALDSGEDMNEPFFSEALKHIRNEMKDISIIPRDSQAENLQEYWKNLFPEGLTFFEDKADVIKDIREKRTVTILDLNDDNIKDIPGEMTFTSNVLLTIPDKCCDLDKLDLPEELKRALPEVMKEEQLYWFDHPVQMGEIQEKNEILYGLKGLSEALAFEKRSNTVDKDARIDVLLSVSVTHHGLQSLAAPYLQYELSQCNEINDLNIYVFTEKKCRELLDILSAESDSISRYFGVDGKYGRHYNFLKAINVLWKISMNPDLKGTFKIDLDQIFPQEELKTYTGKTAFEHFQSPLWGANAIDSKGRNVELSMIAGALVNESDIKKSIFTPDVSIPDLNAPLNDLVFFKHITMALSTRAELMTRYKNDTSLDGVNKAISRIHVTGGTNGILIDALIKHRPFTPSFIGRAEDQAYILSVLNEEEPLLRYFHEDGLIMRHDKEVFAGESIKAAKDGTYIADIMRILYYSYYAALLPGGIEKTKEETYPFTGSYISKYPFTLAYMRFTFKLLEIYEEGYSERADNMMELGETRLQPLIHSLCKKNILEDEYFDEKKQWNLFYDEVEKLISLVHLEDTIGFDKRKRLEDVLNSCRLT